MGREIRRVPPNWQHPKTPDRYGGKEDYRPLFKHNFANRFAEWLADFDRIRAGNLTDIEKKCYPLGLCEWLQDDGNPPDPKSYITYLEQEATWFQVYETVSEGTPVTPPFATAAELVDYLVANGDFWDQRRGDGGWSRANAEAFVGRGWSPSMMVIDGVAKTPRDGI